MMHDLKTWPPFFDDVVSGRKNFEIRQNDRGFKSGDEWTAHEWIPGSGYTGRRCGPMTITYVTPPSNALPKGLCGFSFEKSRRVLKDSPRGGTDQPSPHGETCATRAGTSRNCDRAEQPVDGGANCRFCGHYETRMARAVERYAHCPACGRAPHWVPAKAAPASRQGERLSYAINALPERIRSYVHEIETNCDPAGMVRENVLQRDHIAALEAELAVAESEANGWGAVADDYEKKLADAERERDCGQDGVCAIAPGCLRHWEERARELVRERDELRSENVRLVAKLADMEARVRDAERDADIAELLLAPGHGTPAPKGPTE